VNQQDFEFRSRFCCSGVAWRQLRLTADASSCAQNHMRNDLLVDQRNDTAGFTRFERLVGLDAFQ
jgi:hypothetical protein